MKRLTFRILVLEQHISITIINPTINPLWRDKKNQFGEKAFTIDNMRCDKEFSGATQPLNHQH